MQTRARTTGIRKPSLRHLVFAVSLGIVAHAGAASALEVTRRPPRSGR
jgi:hypothetical protein